MSNSTTEYWSVSTQDGGTVSLNTYAWNITTRGLGRSLPVTRGSNIQVAYKPGQVFRKKFPDSRTFTFSMWTAGIDPVTDQPVPGPQQAQQASDNLRVLQNVFYNAAGNQFELTRRWQYTLPVNLGIPMGAPTMVTATALAEVAGNMMPTTQDPNGGLYGFSIDILLSDPYFYGAPTQTLLPYNTPTTVLNTGDDVAGYVNNTVTLYGPLQYPRVTNSTTNPSTWFQINTVIEAGDSVTFNAENFTAYRASDGINLSGSIVHSGTRQWMLYNIGNNTVALTSSNVNDTGYASASFQPPYA